MCELDGGKLSTDDPGKHVWVVRGAVCVRVRVRLCVCVRTYTYTHTCIHIIRASMSDLSEELCVYVCVSECVRTYTYTYMHTCNQGKHVWVARGAYTHIHIQTYMHTYNQGKHVGVVRRAARVLHWSYDECKDMLYMYIYTCIYVRICYIYIYTCIYYYIYIYIHIYILYYIILYVLNIIRRRACRTQWAPEVTSFFRAMAPLLRPFLAGCTRWKRAHT